MYMVGLVNLVASLLMATVLKTGTQMGGSPEKRMAFIAGNSALWIGAWMIWMGAAVFLLLHFAILKACFEEDLGDSLGKGHKIWFFLAIMIGAAGICADTASETIFSTALVYISQKGTSLSSTALYTSFWTDQFILWDRIATCLTGFLGNGFYCLAGLIFNGIAFSVPTFPRPLAYGGLFLWFSGFALSLATILDTPLGMMITTALTMALFVLWTFGVGHFYLALKEQKKNS